MIGWFLLGVLVGVITTVVGLLLGLRLYVWHADRRSARCYDPDATSVIPRIQE